MAVKNIDYSKVYEFNKEYLKKNIKKYREFTEEREKLNSFIDEKIQNKTALCQKDILDKVYGLEKYALDLL